MRLFGIFGSKPSAVGSKGEGLWEAEAKELRSRVKQLEKELATQGWRQRGDSEDGDAKVGRMMERRGSLAKLETLQRAEDGEMQNYIRSQVLNWPAACLALPSRARRCGSNRSHRSNHS